MTADESGPRKHEANDHNGDQNADGIIIQPIDFAPADQHKQGKGFSLKPWQIGLTATLLVALAIIWYLFSAKSVVIKPVPNTATVAIEGGLQFKMGNHYLLREQTYQLALSAPGYYPLTTELTVSDAQNQNYGFALTPLPGHLDLVTEDNVIVDVWIDDKLIGTSESTVQNIPAGEHSLSLRHERYKDFNTAITIEGRDTTQTLNVNLEPAWAEVTLQSTPAGADIYSSDTLIGQTPATVELLEGTHQLSVKAAGYKRWQQQVDIEAGKAQRFTDITLSKADGLINVTSSPSEASVTVNGKFYGTTPLELALTPNTPHQVLLFKDGYQPANKTLQITSGEESSVSIRLQPLVGDVAITSQPANALVYVDGRLMGRTGQTIQLPARSHRIVVKQEGYEDYIANVTPRPGLQQQVIATLRTAEEAKWDKIPPMIKSPAGQQLKLFRPDVRSTMGSSRREQGRRANEALREVELTRAFYIGLHEVTNAQYRRFETFHSSGHVKGKSLNNEQNPVTNISWNQAARYCNWLSEQEGLPLFYTVEKDKITGINPASTGYRLPTEVEWTWLARFDNGTMKKYAWGEQLPITGKPLNIADRQSAPLLGYIQADYNDGYAVTAPVGSFPPDQHGLYDLSGNVAEWLTDYYGISSGLSLKVEKNPLGPESGDYHVIRGNSWAHGTVTDLRLSFRDYGIDKRYDVGFRVARFVDGNTDNGGQE